MREKYNEKIYRFARFYIIKNKYLFSSSNLNLDDNLKNCYCIKKTGSEIHPEIYVDIKKDNKIIKKIYIGNYQALMNFIADNQNDFIFIKGFSRASMYYFLKMLNNKKQLNIKPVKFNNKIADVHYQRHIETKEQRIQELNVKLENSEEIESAEQYMKISNSVFGKNRHKSRQKILHLKNK